MATKRVTLSAKALRELARELRDEADAVTDVSRDAAFELCSTVGVKVARESCTSPVVANAIFAERTPRGAAVVCEHYRASFEEFGTGIVGKLEGFPDPLDEVAAYESDYQLDGMGHGWKGWRFPVGDGSYRWTWGRPGGGFMAKAAHAMEREGVKLTMVEYLRSGRMEKRRNQPGSVLP